MTADFAARIRERYPEGLTGVFAIGGTRVAYVLEHNREAADPGAMNFAAYAEYLEGCYHAFVKMFLDLGGQNAIVTVLSYLSFLEDGGRGSEYGPLVSREALRLIDESFQAFYRENNVDPYFAGIDTLLGLPVRPESREMAERLAEFQSGWTYREGARKVIWEVESIPLYTFRNLFRDEDMSALDAELASVADMGQANRVLYKHIARKVYGTDVPMPHFYLGTNKSGDLKLRTPMPLALSGGEFLRVFYTPYPSLYTTPETMRRILEDLVFVKRLRSTETDYSGIFTPELARAEYERVHTLSGDPETTVGLSRRVTE